MKYVKGYKHYTNKENPRSTFKRVVESSYDEFRKKKSDSNYSDIGKADNRSIFEICLSSNEYQFLKENMNVDEINTILFESISMVINLSNDDKINEGLLDGIKQKITKSYDTAVNWVDDKIDKAVEFGKTAVKKMKDIIANITDIVSNLFKQTKDALVQMWSFLGTQFSKLVEKMKGGIKKGGNNKLHALVSLLESDNAAKETEEAKKDFVKIKQMVTGGKLAAQEDVEKKLSDKAEEFKDYSADELENTVISDVTTVQTESIINLFKGLIIENGPSILDEVRLSLETSNDSINEKEGVSFKSIFSWVLEGISVIISWKSKLIEKLTKLGTNFLMNFMSNIARAGTGFKYILFGQIIAFCVAFVYEMMHLVHELDHAGHATADAGHGAVGDKAAGAVKGAVAESLVNEAEDPNANKEATDKQPDKKEEVADKNAPADKKDGGKVKELVSNVNIGSLSPDKIISAIDWKVLKFVGLSVVFTLAMKTLLPQLSILYTIIGVCICSFELMETACNLSKSHNGVCSAVHNFEHFADSLFKGGAKPAAH